MLLPQPLVVDARHIGTLQRRSVTHGSPCATGRAAAAASATIEQTHDSPLVHRAKLRVPIQLQSHLPSNIRFSPGVKCFQKSPRDGHSAIRMNLQIEARSKIQQFEQEEYLRTQDVA